VSWLGYFRKWAKSYDRETESYGYEPSRLLRPFLHSIGKRERGLDVGCGTGRSLEVVARFCMEVAGVEPVEKMARRAEEKGFEVLRMRGEDIGELEGKFDFISFFASIDYMDARKVEEGCRKLLTDGGLVFLTVEPGNEGRVMKAFKDWHVVKRIVARAYEGQEYVCLLLSPAEG
jgi:SAM-dependent methyltransferase